MTEALLAEPAPAADIFDLLARIPMRLSVEVGSASMTLAQLIGMKQDAVIELDRETDDPLDILVNGTLIARGEVVTVDGRYGIRICEIVASLQGGIERRS